MKHFGSILEFTKQRNTELMKAYREAIRSCRFISITDVSRQVADTPCSRFWVSEERAEAVCAALMQGKPVLEAMRPLKREMFAEIYQRVMQLKETRRKATLRELVAKVVYSPAPKFYMRPRCVMETIYKIKKGHYDRL